MELDSRQILTVSLKDSINPMNGRRLRISVQRETMANILRSHKKRNTTKAKSREHFAVIVRLNNRANLLECLLILIESPHIVERIGISHRSV
jgi:hypothetical protein